jgi:hypothetical protein
MWDCKNINGYCQEHRLLRHYGLASSVPDSPANMTRQRLPVACRRNTALGCPGLVDLTCLVWPALPQVFPRPQHGRLCSSIASYGRRSCILPTRQVCRTPPPVAPQNPDFQSHYTIRFRVARPDEPFEPCPLAALRLAAAVIASRLLVQYNSRPVSHGLRRLV